MTGGGGGRAGSKSEAPPAPAPPDVPAYADLEDAARRIGAHARRTPVVTSRGIDRVVGAEVAFKCENLQRTGSFKFRGACNAVFSLPEEAAAGGVCTHSSGNHGAALALAASLRSIPATVVMPAGAARIKRRAVEAFGARVVECEPALAAREAALRGIAAGGADGGGGGAGPHVVHPYDDARVIAGQGTAACELLAAGPGAAAEWCEPLSGPLDALLAPVGGGGLLSGAALAGARHGCRVYGAEPLGADDAARSFRAGRILPMEAPRTMADGLRATLGTRNFEIVRRYVEDIFTVSEDAIAAAMRLLWERAKLVVEPSGAVPLAALMEHGPPPGCRRVGVVLSGGNVDLDRLPWSPGP